MLGYVTAEGRGRADALFCEVADHLRAEGVKLAGAVQVNLDREPHYKCHMDLQILSGGDVVRISQDLGTLAEGCRLDPDGLERAVGLVEQAVEAGPDLLIVNKFGKQELDGRGFRPLIGKAMVAGVPVLVAINRDHIPGFEGFSAGIAEKLPADRDRILAWCRAKMAL